ncbi:unnamed protein product [Rotaria sordida]|uniref:CCHC-type domain-containing protein n=1 Tax=Rotaria sordida TaxID=392033 RepID=A0A818SAA5_9BILA|nr:unnamed protein product [Rotaria sordida]CAF1069186.1 unnamed protein product [Rotaria sordida]CAF3668508.1 unnamed protein product [Rotaria sordida]CAF3954682.1 unnamed protein product [Rotaria sordida]
MVDNYNFYVHESLVDKEKRVEGHGLQKLNDKLIQLNNENENSKIRSIKRQATSQTQYDSENEDSILFIDNENENDRFTMVKKNQNNQKRKIQRGEEQHVYNLDQLDESYNNDKHRKTNNYRIYSRRTKTKEIVDDSSYHHVNKKSNNYQVNYHHQINQNDKANIPVYPVNNYSLSYATDLHLTPLKIKCNPTLSDKNAALKFVQELFKRIENSFRKKYTDHKKTIGFDYWWINNDGDLVGITKDLSLYVYLCDTRHYPDYIDSVQLNPILPIHLPPQHAAVIKFVPNDHSLVDIEEDLRKRYSSIYHIEEMNGTRRLHSRHIRLDVYDKIEYNNILNGGIITLGGMLCEVDEYLPAPKILLCTKCNIPGHTKKVCRLEYDRCRRCGNDRSNGDHKQCMILCHHCGGEHQANNYKCPILLEFRRNLIEKLRENPDKLPPQIQMFIPLDCRLRKTEKVLFNEKKPVQQFTYTNSLYEWPILDKPLKNCSYDKHLNNLQNELEAQKHKYQLEIEKINNKLLQYSTNIQKSCIIMQTQINTQKEIIDSTTSIVNDLTLNMNTNIINIINNLVQLLNDLTPHDQMKSNLSKLKDDLKIQHHYIGERQTAYNNYTQNLEKLWLKQSNSMIELFDLCSFTSHNDK